MNAIPPIRDFADGFDPFQAFSTLGGEGHILDPLERLSEIAKKTPVFEADLYTFFGGPGQAVLAHDVPTFVAASYAACTQILTNPQDFSNSINEMHAGRAFGKSITVMDAPLHEKYRRLFQAGFMPKMLTILRPRFHEVIERLIAKIEKEGKADLVGQYAKHFPFQFICDLMDLPEADRAVFHRLAQGQTCIVFDIAHGEEASHNLGEYLTAVINERRELHSDTDFISELANVEVGGERLPDDVLLAFCRQMMNAGGDTSYLSFSNTLAALFTHPEQLAAVKADRNLVARAIEEGLRWGAPLTSVDRVTTREVVVEGVKIPAGARLSVCIAAGNRDESVFADPHKFDIFREQKRHLTFGYGPHICIGQFLARMELQMSTNVMLDRLANVRLNPDLPKPITSGLTFRGTDAVNVIWDLPATT